MTVRVLLFDVLRREVGAGELSADLPDGATAADLLQNLAEAHPSVARHRPIVRLAVNRTYVNADTALADGDEVALITPVSGG